MGGDGEDGDDDCGKVGRISGIKLAMELLQKWR